MTRIYVLGAASVLACCIWSNPAVSDDPGLGGSIADWGASVTQDELGLERGLGVSVIGNQNAVAQSEATGTVNGDVVSNVVNTGQIQDVQVSNVSGFNIYQMNSGNNVNQVVSQAVNLYFVDGP